LTTPNDNSTGQAYQPPANGFRTFLIVWVTQSVSVFGSALTFFSITIWLTQVLYPNPDQKPLLAAALSATGVVWGLANVFLAPVAGAWADRHDRKRTMMAMDFISGCLSLLLVVLIVAHQLQLWLLLIIIALDAALSAFHFSAFDTSYAMIVPPDKLPRANGMMQTIYSLSGILSPGIAAALISMPALARQGVIGGGLGAFLGRLSDGTPLAITIDAVTFFMASATLLFLFIPSPKRRDLQVEAGGKRKSLWADILEGARYIWLRRPMLWLLGTFTMANLVGSFFVLQPLLVKYNLAADWSGRGFSYETALALLTSVGGIGGVAGGIFISTWGGLKKRRVYGVVIPLILSGLAMAAFGLSPWLFLAAGAMAVSEGMIPIMNAHSQTIWQTQTPRELQGRVFSVRRLIAQCTAPFGTVLAGVFGGLLNPGLVLGVMGALLALFCLAQMVNPYLLRVEDKAYLDALAAKSSMRS
jgi:DHA3 family macrolide efflux protein-like MFS transporter